VAGFRTHGQPAALDIVARAIVSERPPNAILIAGPERVGKTTLALDLAAGLLCLADDPTERPCRGCMACRKVDHGNHPDLHRLSPAGAGGQIRIDQARSLIVDLALLPLEGRFRVAIVAAAQRLNPDAQNALLKTLEEPPAGACSSSVPTMRRSCSTPSAAAVRGSAAGSRGDDDRRAAGRARRGRTIDRGRHRPPCRWPTRAGDGAGGVVDVLIHRARLSRSLLDLTEAGRRQRLAAAALLADAATVAEVIERRDGELPRMTPPRRAAPAALSHPQPAGAMPRATTPSSPPTGRARLRRMVEREPPRRSVAPPRSRSSGSGATWPAICWSSWPVARAWCETSPCSRTTSGSPSEARSTTSPLSSLASMVGRRHRAYANPDLVVDVLLAWPRTRLAA
jgi:hypothetical protein